MGCDYGFPLDFFPPAVFSAAIILILGGKFDGGGCFEREGGSSVSVGIFEGGSIFAGGRVEGQGVVIIAGGRVEGGEGIIIAGGGVKGGGAIVAGGRVEGGGGVIIAGGRVVGRGGVITSGRRVEGGGGGAIFAGGGGCR